MIGTAKRDSVISHIRNVKYQTLLQKAFDTHQQKAMPWT